MPAELVEKEFWIHLKETERLIKLKGLGNEWQNKRITDGRRNSVWYEFIFKVNFYNESDVRITYK